jgi:hypothetical protein
VLLERRSPLPSKGPCAMASILLVEDRRGAHAALRSALVIAGHDVVVAGAEHVSGRFDLALVEAAPLVERAKRYSSKVALIPSVSGVRAFVDEVYRLLTR